MTKKVLEDPCVSVIVTSYNRSATILRTVTSIQNQTHKNVDIIIVDDGSTDNTAQLLSTLKDNRINLINHEKNKGATAAKNTGLNNIKGEWFTFVDSDDEIVPEALETLLRVPERIDPHINHVECNGIDAATREFTGQGLDHDQFLDDAAFATKMKGDHWGIIKAEVLQNDRFNEKLPGYEDVLWTKIRGRSRSYYIHQGLEVCYREGKDRISTRQVDRGESARVSRELLAEHQWLDRNRKFRPRDYRGLCFDGLVNTLSAKDTESAHAYYLRLRQVPGSGVRKSIAFAVKTGGPIAARLVQKGVPLAKKLLQRLKGRG